MNLLTLVIFLSGSLHGFFALAAPAKKTPAVTTTTTLPRTLRTEAVSDMAGLRLLSIEPNSVFDQLGLKKNDVLTAVNGTSIQKLEDVENFFKERKAKQVNLEVIRNGRPEIFSYDFNK